MLVSVVSSSSDNGCSELSSIAQKANAARKKILDQLRREESTILQTPLNAEFKTLLEEKFYLHIQ